MLNWLKKLYLVYNKNIYIKLNGATPTQLKKTKCRALNIIFLISNIYYSYNWWYYKIQTRKQNRINQSLHTLFYYRWNISMWITANQPEDATEQNI